MEVLSVRTLLANGARLLDEAPFDVLHAQKEPEEQLAAVVYLNNGNRVLLPIQEDLPKLPHYAERREVVALPPQLVRMLRQKK